MNRIKEILPSLAVIAALVAAWWTTVVVTRSVIFPTPWDVVSGAFELVQDGTLSEHIAASLMRVGTGFLLAVCVAVPLGLWMGWVRGAYSTLNPVFQILRPISPIAWIPIAILWFGVGNASPIYLIFISSDAVRASGHSGRFAAGRRRYAHRSRRGLAGRRRRGNDRAALGARLHDHGLAQRR
jgi:NitT/TauT family transport system permease protein